MDLDRLRRGRARRRRRLAAVAGVLTVGVAAGAAGVVADVEESRLAPKAAGELADAPEDIPTVVAEQPAPPVVLRPVVTPDGLSRGS